MNFIIIIHIKNIMSSIYYKFYNIKLFFMLSFDTLIEIDKGGDMNSTWNYEEMMDEANSYSEVEMSSLYDADDQNDWSWYY